MYQPFETTLKKAAEAPCLLIMLDYDGTLSPIVRQPSEAYLLPGTLELLERLTRLPGTIVAVISGRSISDLSQRVPCPDIILFGNHGMERRGVPIQLPIPLDELKRMFAEIAAELQLDLGSIDGILVENKGPVVSVHYRRSDPRRVIEIMNIVRRVARRHEGVLIVKGKKVLELRPDFPVNKGSAVTDLIKEEGRKCGKEPYAIYAGDDTTDEDAFVAIKRGAPILVGEVNRPTKAIYQLPSPADLLSFLCHLEEARRPRNG
jgi:trehalose 6-phosphate phosphatase